MKRVILLLLLTFASGALFAQSVESEEVAEPEGYKFEDVREVPSTAVKDQSRSGTCWSFAANSLMEAEMLRMGNEAPHLSEMWIVRHSYIEKAIRYVRMHGKTHFAAGGAFDNVPYVIKKYGIVPEEAYPGLGYGTEKHNHSELDRVLKGYVDGVINSRKLTTAWLDGFEGILDVYLGAKPEKFSYKGKEYTPESFAAALGLNMDDYISITSFTHHPFYEQFIFEVPDNWLWSKMDNVPLDELMAIFDNALENDFPLFWAADVSEKGFAYAKGLAVVPEADLESMDGTEQARWVALSDKDREGELYKFEKPGKEKVITQENRQEGFDNYETTDDHGMLITGVAKDQNGTKYYKVQNSWGTSQLYEGFFYASRPYVEYKTMMIAVHRDAIPKDIRAKLKIK